MTQSNLFQVTEITEQEWLREKNLSTIQVALLKNLQASYANQLLRLDFKPSEPQEYIQQQAWFRGVIDILDLLIAGEVIPNS
jgi:hypothetical protein